MVYSKSQLFSICWLTFEFLIAFGGIGGTVYLLVELDDILVTVDEWLVETGNATNYNFENTQESIESTWKPYYGMAIAGIITATVFVMFFFAFELWGTITKKDWVIIASYGFRICFLLDLICITVILHLSGILSRNGFIGVLSFIFIYNSIRLALQMYLIRSLRKTEEINNMKIIPMASDDNDKIHHIMTVKEAKTKHNEEDNVMTSDASCHTPLTDDMARDRFGNRKVTLNVGGKKHDVLWSSLAKRPKTRLGKLAMALTHEETMNYCDSYSLDDNEFFFNIQTKNFRNILNFYQSGKLHMVDEMCCMAFSDDLKYWGIEEKYLEMCCLNKFTTRKEAIMDEINKELLNMNEVKPVNEFPNSIYGQYMKFVWNFMEGSDTSIAAKVITFISISFIIASTNGMILNSVPGIYLLDEEGNKADNPTLAKLEVVCIMWFIVEYVLRLAAAPKKLPFLKDGMNIIDLLSILPFFISLIPLEAFADFNNVRRPIGVFRVLRVLRVFKLARHSSGLQSMSRTLKNCKKELGLLSLFLSIGVLIFSSLCYFAEKDEENTKFTSIPASFWWAVITMTTVGYGDIAPTTPFGKLIGTCCAICGVLVMALPIPIIVNNFSETYKELKQKEKQLKRETERKKSKEKELTDSR